MALIVCDYRGRRGTVPARLAGLGVDIEWAALPTADYAIGRTVLVERKSVRDLHLSVVTGRFWPQVGRLRVAVLDPYLLVEGRDLDDGPLSPNAVRGCIVAAVDLGLRLIQAVDSHDSALWLQRLLARHGAQRPRLDRPVYAQRPKGPTPVMASEAILAAVPGISSGLAVRLLEHFGSLRAVLAASADEWAAVRGIGPARANALSAVLSAAHSGAAE